MKYLIFILLLIPEFSFSQKKDKTETSKIRCCSEFTSEDLTSFNGYQKDEIKKFVLNFRNKNISKPESFYKVKKGDVIQLQVINYNPYLYKIETTGQDSTVNPKIDTQLPFASIDISSLSSVFQNLTDLNSAIAAKTTESKTDTDSSISKKIFGKNEMILEQKILIAKRKQSIVFNYFDSVFNEINTIQGNVQDLNNKIDRTLFENTKKLDFIFDLDPGSNSFIQINSTQSQIEKSFITLKDILNSKKTEYFKFSNDYRIKSTEYVTEINKNTLLKEFDSLIKNYIGEWKIVLNKIDTILSYSELRKYIESINKLKYLRTTYQSLPIIIKDEVHTISIKMSPWETESKLQTYETIIPIPLKQRTIWGVSLGLYTAGLYNESFSNTKITDSLFQLVSDKQSGGAEIGINANTYFATRLSYNSNVFLGGTLGTGLSLEAKPKPRIMIGPNIIFGEKNRISLSAGAVIGYVQKLSESYKVNSTQKLPFENVTKDFLKCSWFLSLHISLLNR